MDFLLLKTLALPAFALMLSLENLKIIQDCHQDSLSFKRPLPQILLCSVWLNACVSKSLWLILQQLVIRPKATPQA